MNSENFVLKSLQLVKICIETKLVLLRFSIKEERINDYGFMGGLA